MQKFYRVLGLLLWPNWMEMNSPFCMTQVEDGCISWPSLLQSTKPLLLTYDRHPNPAVHTLSGTKVWDDHRSSSEQSGPPVEISLSSIAELLTDTYIWKLVWGIQSNLSNWNINKTCVCETRMPPAATKSKLAIFSIKVTVKVTRWLWCHLEGFH